MTDENVLREIKISICNKLMTLSSCCILFHKQDKTLKDLCSEIVDAIEDKYPQAKLKEIEQIVIEQKQKKEKQEKECNKFINNKTLEPNKLSDQDIIDLCYKFYNDFVLKNEDSKKFPQMPDVKIIKLGDYINVPFRHFQSIGYKGISDDFHNRIKNNSEDDIRHIPINLLYTDIKEIININLNTFGGIINPGYQDEYSNIRAYKGEKLNVKNPKYKKFWNWYIKSLDVLAMYYLKKDNTCYVMKKPDELKINVDRREMYFRYGQEEFYYKNKVKLPSWLYKTKAEDLKIEDFLLLQNADAKAVFIGKFGIDRLVEFGTVVDSYENYPDNEMWTKSEYKIIDMHKVIPPQEIFDYLGYYIGKAKPYKYAPFLYMKNQTTGVYHLEGLHPSCKTLYDALKMRYNGLNIRNFEIKDIK